MDVYEDAALLLYIREKKFPEEISLNERRRILSRARCYSYRGDVVFYNDLIVPKPETRLSIIRDIHEALGHVGVARTADGVRKKYFWRNLRDDIRSYVKECGPCQHTAAPKSNSPPRPPPLSEEISYSPWVSISIEFCEPPWSLSSSLHQEGNSHYLMVVVDRYTKWVELVTLDTKSSEEMAEKFENHVLFHIGSPKEITFYDVDCDLSGAFSNMLERWNIQLKKTEPYHGLEESLPDSTVGSIKQILLEKLNEVGVHTPWETLLPQVQYTHNSTPHPSTQVSPFCLMFNRSQGCSAIRSNIQDAVGQSSPRVPVQRRRESKKAKKNPSLTEELTIGSDILWVQNKALDEIKILGPFKVTDISENGQWIQANVNNLLMSIPREEISILNS